jgi:hypothetical protein
MTPRVRGEIRRLWEETPMTGVQIAVKYSIGLGVISGLARRGSWVSYNPSHSPSAYALKPVRTIFDRLDEVNARMDAVLAETSAVIRKERVARAAASAPR